LGWKEKKYKKMFKRRKQLKGGNSGGGGGKEMHHNDKVKGALLGANKIGVGKVVKGCLSSEKGGKKNWGVTQVGREAQSAGRM